MMDKINEILKAHGRRELSMDEMDKVSGGAFTYDKSTGMCSIDGGPEMTFADFCNLYNNMAATYGADLAVDALRSAAGFTCVEMHRTPLVFGQEAMEYMGMVLDRFERAYVYGAKY